MTPEESKRDTLDLTEVFALLTPQQQEALVGELRAYIHGYLFRVKVRGGNLYKTPQEIDAAVIRRQQMPYGKIIKSLSFNTKSPREAIVTIFEASGMRQDGLSLGSLDVLPLVWPMSMSFTFETPAKMFDQLASLFNIQWRVTAAGVLEFVERA